MSPTCPHNMVKFSPLAAEIGSVVWGTPANCNWFCVLASLLQRRRSTEANQTLHDVWPSHVFGGMLSGAKFSLRPTLALSYIGSVTPRHSTSARQPNFVAWYKECNYGTFAEGAAIFGWAAITLGIGPHSSSLCCLKEEQLKAKFHYAIWFEPSSNELRTNYSAMEIGFYVERITLRWSL